MVGREPFAKRTQDRDAASHRRFERHIHPGVLRRCENFLAVQGQERLIRGHHRLTRANGGQDEALGHLVPPHQFDHDVHVGSRDQPLGIGIEANPRKVNTSIGLGIEVRDGDHAQREPKALPNHTGILGQYLDDTLPDGAETDQAYSDTPSAFFGHFRSTPPSPA